jgi:hypothetical protein
MILYQIFLQITKTVLANLIEVLESIFSTIRGYVIGLAILILPLGFIETALLALAACANINDDTFVAIRSNHFIADIEFVLHRSLHLPRLTSRLKHKTLHVIAIDYHVATFLALAEAATGTERTINAVDLFAHIGPQPLE